MLNKYVSGGGRLWSDSTSCGPNMQCILINEWHSYCVPESSLNSASTEGDVNLKRIASLLDVTTDRNFPYSNPVVYEDFADNDISLGPDGAYYFSASNMHYSPGAPILRSHDLVNWEIIGHSVPTLDFGDARYNLAGDKAYRGGTWASTLRYRTSNKTWYWIGCVDFWYTYVYTSPSPTGPWKRSAVFPGGKCYYDCGLLVDDDDTLYVVYGATDVHLAQLSADGLSEVVSRKLFSASDIGMDGIEGNRMYKHNGSYYILNDHPGDNTYIWKASNPWGPYTSKILANNVKSPILYGGAPHQGSLIQTPEGSWYYMSFTWAYPAGRIPVLAPVSWSADGFPILQTDSTGAWAVSYRMPLPERPTPPWTGTDTFGGNSLGPAWEWNHNPDTSKYVVSNGLTLSSATVTDDLYMARNTLTHRIHGEFPVGTVEVDFTNMLDGDRFGLAAFRDRSAYIGVHRVGNTYTITAVHNMTQDESTWSTINKGTVVATALVSAKKIWLRTALDARASGTKEAKFFYSLDGSKYTQLGSSYVMWTNWAYFMGYRYGIFNFATKQLGGSISVLSFSSV
jgi:beta-xylosidase